eukprot:scaffold820_cov376-Prasinococcus_capsulatus_cf.AAC.6
MPPAAAQGCTLWGCKHLPQNRDVWMVLGGDGSLALYKYHYPDQRKMKDGRGQEYGVPGRVEKLAHRQVSTQPFCAFDWHPDKVRSSARRDAWRCALSHGGAGSLRLVRPEPAHLRGYQAEPVAVGWAGSERRPLSHHDKHDKQVSNFGTARPRALLALHLRLQRCHNRHIWGVVVDEAARLQVAVPSVAGDVRQHDRPEGALQPLQHALHAGLERLVDALHQRHGRVGLMVYSARRARRLEGDAARLLVELCGAEVCLHELVHDFQLSLAHALHVFGAQRGLPRRLRARNGRVLHLQDDGYHAVRQHVGHRVALPL